MKTLLIEFVQMVKDLAKPGEAILASMKASSMHLVHMILGAIGEVAELKEAVSNNDRTNIVEELGDYEFYLQGIYQGLEAVPRQLPAEAKIVMVSCDTLCDKLLISTGNLLDKIKRLTMYNKSIDVEEILSLADICRNQLDRFYFSNTVNITRAEVLEGNINKLLKGDRARYKAGSYTDEQANSRTDKDMTKGVPIASNLYSIVLTIEEANWLRASITALNNKDINSHVIAQSIVKKIAYELDKSS